jgi:hypothetical protein
MTPVRRKRAIARACVPLAEEVVTMDAWRDSLATSRLTPTMRAIIHVVDSFVALVPVPIILVQAALRPHAVEQSVDAIDQLIALGWMATPTHDTITFTPVGRAFVAEHPTEDRTRIIVIQAVCHTVSEQLRARDFTTLRQLAPHLHALTDAWQPRNDQYAEALALTYGTYLGIIGDMTQAKRYLDRAAELEDARGATAPPPRRRRDRR